jgi:hypothetical protein
VAKKVTKKTVVRREYTKADVKELRAHSKTKTPVAKIAKLSKRSVGSLRSEGAQARYQTRTPALEGKTWLCSIKFSRQGRWC